MPKTQSKKPQSESVALVVVPTQKDLKPLSKSVAQLMTEVELVSTIEDKEMFDKAVVVLQDVSRLKDEVEAKYKTVAGPLNLALAALRTLFAPMKSEVVFMDQRVRDAMLQWRKSEQKRVDAENERIRRQQEAGKIKPETAEKKMAAVQESAMAKTTKSDSGAKVTFVTERHVVVTDPSKIPDKYWVIDMKALEKDVLAGVTVLGTKIDTSEHVSQ